MKPPSITKNPNAVALGRLGGKSKSPAKQAAVRINGTKTKKRLDILDGINAMKSHLEKAGEVAVSELTNLGASTMRKDAK